MFCFVFFDFCGLFTIAAGILYLDVKEFSSTSLVMLPKFCEGEIAEKGLGSVLYCFKIALFLLGGVKRERLRDWAVIYR